MCIVYRCKSPCTCECPKPGDVFPKRMVRLRSNKTYRKLGEQIWVELVYNFQHIDTNVEMMSCDPLLYDDCHSQELTFR